MNNTEMVKNLHLKKKSRKVFDRDEEGEKRGVSIEIRDVSVIS